MARRRLLLISAADLAEEGDDDTHALNDWVVAAIQTAGDDVAADRSEFASRDDPYDTHWSDLNIAKDMTRKHCWEPLTKESSIDHWDMLRHDDFALMGLEQWRRPVHSYRSEGQRHEGMEMTRVDVWAQVEGGADGDCYWKEGHEPGFPVVTNEETYSSHMLED